MAPHIGTAHDNLGYLLPKLNLFVSDAPAISFSLSLLLYKLLQNPLESDIGSDVDYQCIHASVASTYHFLTCLSFARKQFVVKSAY